MASLNYDCLMADTIANGAYALAGATVRAMLVTSAYVPDQVNHKKRSDVTGEVTGAAGYTAGGQVVTVTASVNSGLHYENFTVQSPQWSSASITARGVVFYHSRGGAASADELISYLDFGMDVTSVNGLFNVVLSNPLVVKNPGA